MGWLLEKCKNETLNTNQNNPTVGKIFKEKCESSRFYIDKNVQINSEFGENYIAERNSNLDS